MRTDSNLANYVKSVALQPVRYMDLFARVNKLAEPLAQNGRAFIDKRLVLDQRRHRIR